MGARKELLLCLGTALATTAGLFTLQSWYSSYLDVVVIHGDLSDVPINAKLQALRSEEDAKLSSGRLPIGKAMEALAQRGRDAFPNLAPKPSDDLSAMSGWVHKPGFQLYVPRQSVTAAAAVATPLAHGTGTAPDGAPPSGGERR